MNTLCVKCSKTLLTKTEYETIKGRIKRLYRVCDTTTQENSDQITDDSQGLVESFITFTCDYGYLIGILCFVWVIQASLHRHEVRKLESSIQNVRVIKFIPIKSEHTPIKPH